MIQYLYGNIDIYAAVAFLFIGIVLIATEIQGGSLEQKLENKVKSRRK
jgi:L-asparagine transporter-like permease